MVLVMIERVNDCTPSGRRLFILGVLGWSLALGSHGPALATPLLFAVPGRQDGSLGGILGIGVSLLGGAAIGGAVGYGVATATAPELVTLGIGGGVAVGGALAVVLTLLGAAGEGGEGSESVTVEGTEDGDPPRPMPADLFAEHPDPLIYYDDGGDGPVVRAVNTAFEETFDVSGSTVTEAPLGDALMVTERASEVVAGATNAEHVDLSVECETGRGVEQFRVRTAAVADAAGTRGYVVYTPLD
jgi:hypothetical protein